jgi:hypothetical protein
MRSFLRLERFALTEKALGFFGVWIGLRPVAAVRSVERLRMSADAHFIADHVTLVLSVPRVGIGGNEVFSLRSLPRQSSRIAVGTQGAVPKRLQPIDFTGLELAARGSPQRTACEPQHRLSCEAR